MCIWVLLLAHTVIGGRYVFSNPSKLLLSKHRFQLILTHQKIHKKSTQKSTIAELDKNCFLSGFLSKVFFLLCVCLWHYLVFIFISGCSLFLRPFLSLLPMFQNVCFLRKFVGEETRKCHLSISSLHNRVLLHFQLIWEKLNVILWYSIFSNSTVACLALKSMFFRTHFRT